MSWGLPLISLRVPPYALGGLHFDPAKSPPQIGVDGLGTGSGRYVRPLAGPGRWPPLGSALTGSAPTGAGLTGSAPTGISPHWIGPYSSQNRPRRNHRRNHGLQKHTPKNASCPGVGDHFSEKSRLLRNSSFWSMFLDASAPRFLLGRFQEKSGSIR